jgi:hypothetical protein
MVDIDTYGIRAKFIDHEYITKEELYRYFSEHEPTLKDTTLRWRIYYLKKNRVLLPVKRGVYELNSLPKKSLFDPPDSRKMDDLYSIYFSSFKMQPCALWSTEWLTQFMELQPTHHFTVFEIEKELTHPLFFYLKQEKKDAYLNPDREMMKNYVMERKNPVVVRTLLSRAPLQKTRNGLPIASLEKILVDVFCDKDLFIAYQGSELKNIFTNAWKNYSLNLSVLMNYAKRRKRSKSMLDFLKKNSGELHKVLSK